MNTQTYVATAKDIEQLVLDRCKADSVMAGSRNTYLRMLIATSQKRLDISVIRAPRKPHEVTDALLLEHVQMLDTVHGEFYEVVKQTASRIPKNPDETRTLEEVLASRIVFARSAYSTVRAWIMRGRHTLNSIVASRATKHELAALTPKREPKPGAVRKLRIAPLMQSAETILEKIVESAKTDREAAIIALQDVINMLTHGFDTLGMSSASIRDAVSHTATGVIKEAATRLSKRLPVKKAA